MNNNTKSEQAVTYFNNGFQALFKKYTDGKLTKTEFLAEMNQLKQYAHTNCRKDIIRAFNNGFSHGVFWHIDTTTSGEQYDRPNGEGYYEYNFDADEQ
jgi:hypothetical protein